MDLEYGGVIVLKKELNSLDKFTVSFCSVLEESAIEYVLVSGYVSILFGRSRSSEDIDLIIRKMNLAAFKEVWKRLKLDFYCINTESPEIAYEDYLMKGTAIRFSRKDSFIPNMEFKFNKNDLDVWTLDNRKKVELNGTVLYISPIESQIAFKLFLGSEKDIEDAKHLYELFSDKLDMGIFKGFCKKLNIDEEVLAYL